MTVAELITALGGMDSTAQVHMYLGSPAKWEFAINSVSQEVNDMGNNVVHIK